MGPGTGLTAARLQEQPPPAGWRGLVEGYDQVVHTSSVPARPRIAAPLPDGLHPDVVTSLERGGITDLYLFQHEAAGMLLAGEHVTLVGGTGSGKSLCYQLPLLQLLRANKRARALYLAPTKALAQDQARRLRDFGARWAVPALYDGDTPQRQRAVIRRTANLLLTNPDMLSAGILPRHGDWASFFAGLEMVVIDEAHVYRGVFGSHVAQVLRRLRRLAAHYGADPVWVASSGTIANPADHFEHLLGLSPHVVGDAGAPSAGRELVLWNPELDEQLGERDSPLGDASKLYALLLEAGVPTIVFARTRKACELMHSFTVDRLVSRGRQDLAAQIAPYRAGYTAEERRATERALANGDLLGVTATNALELGIDIGSLEAAICVTFPGSMTSLLQQWGRAGRGRRRGLSVLVAGEDALDQYFMREPAHLLDRPVEQAVLSTTNPRIVVPHLAAAACELPLGSSFDDQLYGPAPLGAGLAELRQAGQVRDTSEGAVFVGRAAPAASISLRSTGRGDVAIVDQDTGALLGHIELGRAHSTVFPGAVYLHRGRSFLVHELDLDRRVALVSAYKAPWYTLPKLDTDVTVLETKRRARHGRLELEFGLVEVTDQLVAYQRKSVTTHAVLDLVPCPLPPVSFVTEAVWFAAPEIAVRELPADRLLGSLHAAEHAMIAMLPLLAICDRADIGGLSIDWHAWVEGPAIFVYDGHEGGVGIAERGFDEFLRWARVTRSSVRSCPCEDGCPSCVQSPKCGNLNDPLDKAGAVQVLDAALTMAGTGGQSTKDDAE